LFDHTLRLWDVNWRAGTHLTIDESMIGWEGASAGHLSFIPRKPHPLGFQMKTVCDSKAGLFLNAEFAEGRDIDARKKYYAEFGATTGTMLRLCERWSGSGRVIIGDSWFGSVKTAEELAEFDLKCILSVKTAHRGFPKSTLLAAIPNRGDVKAFTLNSQLGYEGEGK
jgi:hypothetical protein